MRYQIKLLKVISIIAIVFFVLTIILSYFQVKNEGFVIWGILNNIAICVMTGCLIILVQIYVLYRQEKRIEIMEFYRLTMQVEELISDYPYNDHGGFIEADQAKKNIQPIIRKFNDEYCWAYHKIDKSRNKDIQINAVVKLFDLYKEQIEPFKEMETSLIAAIRFMNMTDEELLKDGIIDIQGENKRINDHLLEKEHNISEVYNNENMKRQRNVYLIVLEDYLFGEHYISG